MAISYCSNGIVIKQNTKKNEQLVTNFLSGQLAILLRKCVLNISQDKGSGSESEI